MSTIKAFRKPSKIQFLETMYQLVDHVWRSLRRFPKSTISIQNELRQLIDDTENCIIIANSVGTQNKTELANKILLFEKSIGYLNAFDCKMSRFIDHYGHGKNEDKKIILSEYAIKHMAELVDEEVKLLKGVLKILNKLEIE